MAEAKKKATANEEKTVAKFSKTRILTSDTYKKHRDLLEVLLEEGKSYTKEEVAEKLDKYLKGKVK